jgi:hypothetical protein
MSADHPAFGRQNSNAVGVLRAFAALFGGFSIAATAYAIAAFRKTFAAKRRSAGN